MKPFALQNAGTESGFDEWRPEFAADRGDGPDYCGREGALELKKRIEAYWAGRGQDVAVFLHNVGFHPAIRAARFDVRSDLVNGMPRTRKSSAKVQDVFVEDYDQDSDDIAFE